LLREVDGGIEWGRGSSIGLNIFETLNISANLKSNLKNKLRIGGLYYEIREKAEAENLIFLSL
jgi:hypothetical protein